MGYLSYGSDVLPAASGNLQIPSFFFSITKEARTEIVAALKLIERDSVIPPQDINSELDKWYLRRAGEERLLDILSVSIEDKMTVLSLRVLYGPEKDLLFRAEYMPEKDAALTEEMLTNIPDCTIKARPETFLSVKERLNNDSGQGDIADIPRAIDKVRTSITRYLSDKTDPIDIVIDLSLLAEKNIKLSAETWANLILSCAEIKNVNFVFKNIAFSGNADGIPDALRTDINNAPCAADMLALLRKKIDGELYASRVKGQKRPEAIEIPIVSRTWLDWLDKTGVGLASNQYPVAMDGTTMQKDNKTVLRNFEAALTIGLAKAALIIAKKKDKGQKELEEKELSVLITDLMLLPRLQALYKTIFADTVYITEKTLFNMIYPASKVRLNLARSLALPPVAVKNTDTLRERHERMTELEREV